MSDETLPRPARRDLQRNREELLSAATRMLQSGEALTASAVVARAGLARATLYRHFASIADLTAEARELLEADGQQLPDERSIFDVPTILERAPAHRVAHTVVEEARRRAPGFPVALYLMDIDGTRLLRAAGDEALPDEIVVRGIGPEIAEEHLEQLHELLHERVPGAVLAPLLLRRRGVGVLLVVGDPDPAVVTELAREAAVAVDVAMRFTDELQRARRRRPTTASAEVQQLLLAPRVARMTGLRFAGHVAPGYDHGGNWFDHAENEDGAWIAAIDAAGSGARAAAISAVALGALRAARNAGSTPADALLVMHDAVRAIGLPDASCNAWVARWHAPSALLFWAAAGDLVPWCRGTDGSRRPLLGATGAQLGGVTPPSLETNHHRLHDGELVVLLSDGAFGADGAALSVQELDRVLADCSSDPATLVAEITAEVAARPDELADDAMVVALAVLDG